MEETRDLIKTIRDTKGIFHAKMGSVKYRNSMYPTEAEDVTLCRLIQLRTLRGFPGSTVVENPHFHFWG